MKGIVIYRGKYGATAQYASWLAEALYLPLLDADRQFIDKLENYDYVVIGSPVYLGKLLIRDWLRQNEAILIKNKVFLFVVSASATDDHLKQAMVLHENVPLSLLPDMETFFLPGRVIINKLSWLDKLIVKLGAFMEHDKAKKELMLRGFDGVKREHINPLIKEALQFSNAEVLP